MNRKNEGGTEMFTKVLIANRGEIARRIIRTLDRLGIDSVVVHSEADAQLPFVREAGEAILIPGSPSGCYRDLEAILAVARETGAQAVHPGYGFLSEDSKAASAIEDAGLAWVGPSARTIESMGDKIRARVIAEQSGVPIVPGTREPVLDQDEAVTVAEQIGLPVMVKASAGGGGMGMQVASTIAEVASAYTAVQGFAQRSFSSPDILIERYFPRVRHVEVQVLGLADGSVVAVGERDCSVQRRNQKLAEESPPPGLPADLLASMRTAAVALAESIEYRSAGTVECLLDVDTQSFYFLEMNTRLQVEHPVTEMRYGLDLVEEQLRIAAGLAPAFKKLTPDGHSIEFRINAEEPPHFIPRPGVITHWNEPSGPGVRVDSGYEQSSEVTAFYDSLMSKLVVHGCDRTQAITRMRAALGDFAVEGPASNIAFFEALLKDSGYCSGDYDTTIVGRMVSHA